MANQDGKKRAISLGGGGPAAGLHIGVLRAFEEKEVKFDVWALSCIGAWVGVIYNQFKDLEDEGKAAQTETFFRKHIFRDDDSYARFPINSVFAPDWMGYWEAFQKFVFDAKTYDKLWVPGSMIKATGETFSFLTSPEKWNKGDYSDYVFELSSKNPMFRFYASMMYLSEITGLTKLYYPEGSLLKNINFEAIERLPEVMYHNAWNLSQHRLEQFANAKGRTVNTSYGKLNDKSLCACSALPYIEQTVTIGKDVYCEGALIDTLNLKDLLVDHQDLDEIWIIRIVDEEHVHPPRNIHDALGNLCQLFAATVGQDDIELFEYRARDLEEQGIIKKKPEIIEVPVSPKINFDWTHSNLETAIACGYDEAMKKINEKIVPPSKGGKGKGAAAAE